MNKVWLFDVDRTLTFGIGDAQLAKTAVVWLQKHKPQRVALCSNQGGVGLRYWMESGGFGDPAKYPTETAVRERMAKLAGQIQQITGGEARVYLAFSYLSQKGNWSPVPEGQEDNPEWSQEWRKPNPGMLLQAAKDFGVDTSECTFVGDMDTDKAAAEAAGMAFEDADTLMAINITIGYPSAWVVEWLRPYMRIGLKVEESFARFEAMIAKEAKWWRVGQISFERFEGDGEEFSISPQEHTAVIDGETLSRMLNDIFINREWLVYESAEEHADALRGTRWLSATTLVSVYGLEPKEAWRLVRDE